MDKKVKEYFEKLNENNNHMQFLKEFDKELANNSDRGIALICGSIIDEMLKDLLKRFLINSSNIDKHLFGISQPLGNLDNKIKMAFYLGLISNKEMKNIILMQRIRNKFAHQIKNISFENDEIKNISSNFTIPKDCFLPKVIPFPIEGTDELPVVDLNPIKKDTQPREKFIYIFKYLFMNLTNRTYGEPLEKRTEYTEEYTAERSISLQLNTLVDALEAAKQPVNRYRQLKVKYEESLGNAETKEEMEKLKKVKEDLEELEEMEKNYEVTEKALTPIVKLQTYTLSVIKNSMNK
ncbi:MltR family transcriptional regulator [Peribacillus frigoritolerans]|uniref:MltR family transcriptional regulator n=1 Tax=Peribacillus frigoritolerans TaxID=450367 RepID=UPI003D2E5F03